MKDEKKMKVVVNQTLTFGERPAPFTHSDLERLINSPNGSLLLTDEGNHHIRLLNIDHQNRQYLIRVDGYDFTVQLQRPLDQTVKTLGLDTVITRDQTEVHAPMPGQVIACHVQVGDEVSDGSPLITLEAMKMENVVQSISSGVVQSIHASIGDTVAKGAVLIQLQLPK
ncbi:MAG: acetyl-CoA carboxylase biotin carboxyl carrier protein subunit [Saprospiraceae bacterium]|nr:acetyl-CoA carboxylase biotin carboxyl carrier protein subunit [Saprospiraceae bacterium]